MFKLDISLFDFLYKYCKSLGNAFGYGAFEGLVLYSTVILLGITATLDKRKQKNDS